jgi:hypothetical protein
VVDGGETTLTATAPVLAAADTYVRLSQDFYSLSIRHTHEEEAADAAARFFASIAVADIALNPRHDFVVCRMHAVAPAIEPSVPP